MCVDKYFGYWNWWIFPGCENALVENEFTIIDFDFTDLCFKLNIIAIKSKFEIWASFVNFKCLAMQICTMCKSFRLVYSKQAEKQFSIYRIQVNIDSYFNICNSIPNNWCIDSFFFAEVSHFKWISPRELNKFGKLNLPKML